MVKQDKDRNTILLGILGLKSIGEKKMTATLLRELSPRIPYNTSCR